MNDQYVKCRLPVQDGSDFSIFNIPFGIFSPAYGAPRGGTRIGDTIIDLSVMEAEGCFDGTGLPAGGFFSRPVLNDFIALGRQVTSAVRNRIIDIFSGDESALEGEQPFRHKAFYRLDETEMHLPVRIGNYTDFYASEQHAFNVGVMFRDPANALLPNWKHLPVGYHGRASSIVISGTPIRRPKGQMKGDADLLPVFGPTRQLDFELEVGFVIGKETRLGDSIPVGEAENYIFGLLLFNDLSARDIQKWEYVPLGPFLGKNFGSVVSPWIVTLEALDPFRTAGPAQDPEVLPYLRTAFRQHFDVTLEVALMGGPQPGPGTASGHDSALDAQETTLLTASNLKYLYWSFPQMLAHHTVNGCNVQVGDVYATGTISGPEEGSYGSMLEIAWKGTKPVALSDGSLRTFIEDGDTVIIRGYAEKDGIRVGFGECVTLIMPAKH